ncbi:MAG: FeoA domain-containing protein, partial [Muribaculaceae bacterium]|nr:FeoA domain-containing protein [Muribaculaceae bacterium]
MRLSELKEGHEGYVVKILGHGAFRKRLTEMGFVRGRLVRNVLSAPLKDPVKYSLMGYEVSLRRSEAQMVEIVDAAEGELPESAAQGPAVAANDASDLLPAAVRNGKTINIALIGNPNCGKTSMFNSLSGATE